MSDVKLELTAEPSASELDAIGDGLGDFNVADVGPSGRVAIAVLVRGGGKVLGGISGYTAWGWLYVQ